MRFILVRHGESEMNVLRRFCGHTDAPLTEKGHEQAEFTAEKLKVEHVDRIVASDLSRAFETALKIATHHEAPVESSEAFREMDFGEWEGLTYDEILSGFPEKSKEWVDDYFKTPCPGGESLITFYDRITQAFQALKKETKKGESVLLAAHAGVIQAILSKELMDDVKGYWRFKINNCGVAFLDYETEFAVLTRLDS